MSLIINIGVFLLNILYFFFKLLPVQKKVTYISRQSDHSIIDFDLLRNTMEEEYPDYKNVMLLKMLRSGLKNHIMYAFYMFKQMYHIATSETVVLDTYCIPVCILKQRKSLTVIQIWHALGSFKKFGYSILDRQEGSSSKIAHLMRMHKNYTFVLTSSEYTKPFFAEAFNVSQNQMKVIPLPRVDMIKDHQRQLFVKEQIYRDYPHLEDKKTIVYVPTFRKNGGIKEFEKAIQDLIEAVDYSRYNLVLKLHPLTRYENYDARVVIDHKYSSIDMCTVADAIITDYSATIFEASLLNIPLYFYAFDYENYTKNRDFYIDYESLPGYIGKSATDIIEHLQNDQYDLEKLQVFSKLMISDQFTSNTKEIVKLIVNE